MSETDTRAPDGAITNTKREQQLKNAREQYKLATTTVSDRARFYGIGLSSVTFVLLLSDSSFARLLIDNYLKDLIRVSFCGLFALLFEFLQYFFAAQAARQAIKKLEGGQAIEGRLYKSAAAWWSRIFFGLKQLVLVVGIIYLLFILYGATGKLKGVGTIPPSSVSIGRLGN